MVSENYVYMEMTGINPSPTNDVVNGPTVTSSSPETVQDVGNPSEDSNNMLVIGI